MSIYRIRPLELDHVHTYSLHSRPSKVSFAEFAKVWPNITVKKEAPPDAKEWEGVPDKFEKHFSSEPGTGD